MKFKMSIKIGILLLLGIGFLIGFIYKPWTFTGSHISFQCQIKEEEKIVRGNSLTPIIEQGTTVKILFGYYDCNEIKRGDIVAYRYAGNPDPIIKIVKGLPGDKFELRESDEMNWNILINGQVLKNSKNEPYLISGNRYKMLSLYEKDYNGIVPDDTYLILGNLVSGSMDSTRFGLIDKSDILGKIEY